MNRPLFFILFVLLGLWPANVSGQDEGIHDKEGIPYLGEAIVYTNVKSSQDQWILAAGTDITWHLIPAVNPAMFFEFYRAKIDHTYFKKPFDLAEVWFGGGLHIDVIPHWLSVSPQVGSHFVVEPDDHLNGLMIEEKWNQDREHGVLFHFVAELSHPKHYFHLHFEADLNEYLNNHDDNFQIYLAKLNVPVFKNHDWALDVGLQASYFSDSELAFQSWDVVPFLGPRWLTIKELSLGVDIGAGYARERDHRGSHDSLMIFGSIFVETW